MTSGSQNLKSEGREGEDPYEKEIRSNYYYDDSTGYQIYDEEDEDEVDKEDDEAKT